jgi:NAD-dependent deacetylase
VVWPAAGYPALAQQNGAFCIEINPEPSDNSPMYQRVIRGKAGEVLSELFV